MKSAWDPITLRDVTQFSSMNSPLVSGTGVRISVTEGMQ